MQPTSAVCRAREAHHRALAATAALPNARRVATLAAAAWGKEALLAEKREARAAEARLLRKSATIVHASMDDRLLSENPDLGFADR
ncbi:hypothetical protein LZK98_14095 [Sphingomonas cannabina]|uniref:hypothetical protein n=1 Tax=Sphingomonas cannabina TaxID=2899123 RepID=UPI001F406E48|nr:hypothetical protein [Sphingomonas cannabina]UIJ44201.1 hypothetical protein LZK98_14095 [Sphingomonas cannabina]